MNDFNRIFLDARITYFSVLEKDLKSFGTNTKEEQDMIDEAIIKINKLKEYYIGKFVKNYDKLEEENE